MSMTLRFQNNVHNRINNHHHVLIPSASSSTSSRSILLVATISTTVATAALIGAYRLGQKSQRRYNIMDHQDSPSSSSCRDGIQSEFYSFVSWVMTKTIKRNSVVESMNGGGGNSSNSTSSTVGDATTRNGEENTEEQKVENETDMEKLDLQYDNDSGNDHDQNHEQYNNYNSHSNSNMSSKDDTSLHRQQPDPQYTTTRTIATESNHPLSPSLPIMNMQMKPIGYISSVYRLCVGTPRQGLLAPHSRGRINFIPNRIAFDSIQDLESFSHVWVVFIFHLNSNQHPSTNENRSGSGATMGQFPSKIKPPALGGKKVGIFATRSPHRPNPIGFSLCQLDRIVVSNKQRKKKDKKKMKNNRHEQEQTHHHHVPYYIDISGLDLVDGTPVLDIKPYVPHYDAPLGYGEYVHDQYYDPQKQQQQCHPEDSIRDTTTSWNTGSRKVTLPPWVSDGLSKRRNVDFTPEARKELNHIFLEEENVKKLEFYGKHTGRDETNMEALQRFMRCIQEVLSVDVRSKWQTEKARKGKSRAETTQRVKELSAVVGKEEESCSDDTLNGSYCTQQLDRLLIKFQVQQGEHVEKEDEKLAVDTQGSGADDVIVVVGVEYLDKKSTH